MYLCFEMIIQGKIHFSDNSHSFSYMGAFKHIINFRCVSYLSSKVSWPSLGNVPLKELPRFLVFKREFQSLYQMFGKLSNDLNIFFLPAKRSQVSCKFQFSSNLHILVWQWIDYILTPAFIFSGETKTIHGLAKSTIRTKKCCATRSSSSFGPYVVSPNVEVFR